MLHAGSEHLPLQPGIVSAHLGHLSSLPHPCAALDSIEASLNGWGHWGTSMPNARLDESQRCVRIMSIFVFIRACLLCLRMALSRTPVLKSASANAQLTG